MESAVEDPHLAPEPDNVFEEEERPARSTPGILLTVEGEVLEQSERRPARRMQSSPARSPSGSRRGHRPRDPYLSGGPNGVSRSQSMRTARRPQSVDPTHRFRQRIASIPNDMSESAPKRIASNQSLPLPGDESDVMRLRNFAVTSKGLVNRGDSFRSKSRSTHSVASVGSSPVKHKDDSSSSRQVEPPEEAQGAAAPPPQDAAPRSNRYIVLVVGAPDVGKTALINQFMTSEYICAYDNSQDEENEKSVGVIVNGTESELVFLEHQYAGDTVDPFWESFGPDAYLVVYSVTSKRSLGSAKEILRRVQRGDPRVHARALILVGNKTDLARHRCLSTDDGRSVASEEGSKFIETSAGINHHVDELLVGIVSQIQLRVTTDKRAVAKRESVSLGSGGARLLRPPGRSKAKGILKKILKKACSRSKSCDNLHVL